MSVPFMNRLAFALALLSPIPAAADTVTDAIDAASAAYADGDLNGASAGLITATRELAAVQAGLLSAQFPAAPDGWTRSDNTTIVEGLAAFGGGSGAEATYTAADGTSVTLSAYADNMMVSSMAGMLGNPAMLAMMGKVVEINGTSFADQDGNYSALINNRVLLQTSGGTAEQAQQILGLIDFAKLGAFDAK